MSLNLGPEMVAAIVTVFLTIVAGIVGYFIQQYRTSSKPFLKILDISGQNYEETTVSLPADIAEKTRNSTFYTGLTQNVSIDTLQQCSKEFEVIVRRSPEVCKWFDAYEQAVDREDYDSAQSQLIQILSSSTLDLWMTPMIGENHLEIPDANEELDPVVSVIETPEQRSGCFWIGFSNKSTVFGQQLNHFNVFGVYIRRFLSLVERLEHEKIKIVLNQVRENIKNAEDVAKDVLPVINEKLDNNSRWSFSIYAANLGAYPFLIDPVAKVRVEDETGAKFDLVVMRQKADGSIERVKSSAPLVVKSENDASFDFATSKTQSEMDRGNALREAFESNKAKCTVDMTIESVGYKKVKIHSTAERAFTA